MGEEDGDDEGTEVDAEAESGNNVDMEKTSSMMASERSHEASRRKKVRRDAEGNTATNR
jgi:hypothetical protein